MKFAGQVIQIKGNSMRLMGLRGALDAARIKCNSSPHLRFIIQNDRELTLARLVLVQGVVTVLASGLALLGVAAPNEMR